MSPLSWQQRAAGAAARIGWSGLAITAALTLAAYFAIQAYGLRIGPIHIDGWKDKAETFQGERNAERTAHQATKTNYRAAQAEAALREAARLERVRAQQEEISDAIEQDYGARLAELGARAERLRQELRTRAEPAGAGGGIEGAAFRDAAGRAGEATGDRGFPATGNGSEGGRRGAFGRTEEEQLERDIVATRQALQLDALISWVLEQSAIDPNAEVDEPGERR